jgi:hypothetical protein
MAGNTPFAAFSLFRDGRLRDGPMIPMVSGEYTPSRERPRRNLFAQAQLMHNRFVTLGIV